MQIIIFSISTFSVISMMMMIIIVKTFFQRCSHTPTKTSCTNNRLPQMVATTIITNIIVIICIIISDVVIIIVCIDLVTPLLRSNRNSWLKTIIHCHQIHPLSVRLSHHHWSFSFSTFSSSFSSLISFMKPWRVTAVLTEKVQRLSPKVPNKLRVEHYQISTFPLLSHI